MVIAMGVDLIAPKGSEDPAATFVVNWQHLHRLGETLRLLPMDLEGNPAMIV
jgi:hypothetical protein